MNGVLYGVSVGPGDPELMTLKAVKIIDSCSVIAVPRTNTEKTFALEIAEQVCDISKKEIVYLDFLMSADIKSMERRHDENAELICKYLKKGIDTALLNIGDVSIYSTFSYISARVKEKGIKVEVCPGVTSFCAAAAAMGEPLVQGKNSLTVVSPTCSELDDILESAGTAVIMKGGRNAGEIKKKLKENHFDKVYAVCSCGLENEGIYRGYDEIPDNCGYFTVITAVGEK